jgi:hypothetical protein
MRDPDLVHRAERAARALERAWGHWRTTHGLGSDPLPPVSSYVGYSLDEPWGQPRVVFGVSAEDAERLTVLLDGHDCVGPVHAELTGRPDWRHGPAGGSPLPGWPLPDELSIPLQAPQPWSDDFSPVSQADPPARMDTSAAEPGGLPAEDLVGARADHDRLEPGSSDAPVAGEAAATGALGEHDPAGNYAAGDHAPGDSVGVGYASSDHSGAAYPGGDYPSGDAASGDSVRGAGASGDSVSGDGPTTDNARPGSGGSRDPAAAADGPGPSGLSESTASRQPRSRSVPAAPLARSAVGSRSAGRDELGDLQPTGVSAEPAGAGQLPPLPPPGTVAFRKRSDQPLDVAEEPDPLAGPLATSGYDFMPSQGPGYRGPRYQGYPPQYRDGSEPDEAPADRAAVPEADREEVPPAASQPQRAKSRQVSRLGRGRRQGPGAHEAWGPSDGQPAADHAM